MRDTGTGLHITTDRSGIDCGALLVAVGEPGTPRGRLVEALREVIDPDLGINIVDLGFVLDVVLDDEHHATIAMTLTSAACPWPATFR